MSGRSRTLYLGGLICYLLVFFAGQSAIAQPRLGRGLQFTDPKRYYEELLEKDSRNAVAHYHLGLEHLREPQDTEKAVEHLERAVELDGANAEYHYRLGEAYIADFTYASIFRKPFIAARVKAQLEQAVQYDPAAIQYREALIEYYVCAPSILGGSFGRAREQADAIAAVDPYLGTLARARICAEEGEPKNAVTLYKKAIRMHPRGWQAYQRFGIYYLNRRQVEEAIVMFKKYVEVAPINADSYLNLGRAYERKRMYNDAITAFQMAFERDQSLTHLVFRIAQLYEFKGSRREAVQFYQKYLGLVSTGRAADDARTKIRDLSS
ncbi:MAG: tetratricopeptide repeat protein [Ignavibacteria bacterium]|nr:tetratricopeptide repeat protein [Ignavibacteria bacterium]